MKLTLTHDELNAYCSELHDSNAAFKCHYPADSFERQQVHTVYGGANLFKAGFAAKLGEVARGWPAERSLSRRFWQRESLWTNCAPVRSFASSTIGPRSNRRFSMRKGMSHD